MTIATEVLRSTGVSEKKIQAIQDITKSFGDFYSLLRIHLEHNFDSVKILNSFEDSFYKAKEQIILQEEMGEL